MKRETIVTVIGTVLREEMRHLHLDGFGRQARLAEDSYLDAVQLLQLILALEMKLGGSVPETAMSRQAIATVADLAAIFSPVEYPAARPEAIAAPPRSPAPMAEGVHATGRRCGASITGCSKP